MPRKRGQVDALDDSDALVSIDEFDESETYDDPPSQEDMFPSILDPDPMDEDEDEDEEEDDEDED